MRRSRTSGAAGSGPGYRSAASPALAASIAVVLAGASALAGGDVERRGAGGRGGSAAETGRAGGADGRTWGEVETPAGLSFRVEAAGGTEEAGVAVRAVLYNGGAEPLTVALDPRLADVELRAGRTRVRCPSPQDLSPLDLRGAEVGTVPPGAEAEVRLDLLYHCWNRLDRARRAAGGDPVEVRVTYRVVRVDPGLGQAVGGAGRLEARTEMALGLPGEGPTAEDASQDDAPVEVEAGKTDAADGEEVWLRVAVRNRTAGPLRLVDHPTQFRFDVTGPTGAWTCAMTPWRITPLGDLLVRLRRGQKYERRLELTRYCPPGALVEPGVYWVAPIYDPYLAERAPEAVVDREVRGEPVPVRVRRGGNR